MVRPLDIVLGLMLALFMAAGTATLAQETKSPTSKSTDKSTAKDPGKAFLDAALKRLRELRPGTTKVIEEKLPNEKNDSDRADWFRIEVATMTLRLKYAHLEMIVPRDGQSMEEAAAEHDAEIANIKEALKLAEALVSYYVTGKVPKGFESYATGSTKTAPKCKEKKDYLAVEEAFIDAVREFDRKTGSKLWQKLKLKSTKLLKRDYLLVRRQKLEQRLDLLKGLLKNALDQNSNLSTLGELRNQIKDLEKAIKALIQFDEYYRKGTIPQEIVDAIKKADAEKERKANEFPAPGTVKPSTSGLPKTPVEQAIERAKREAEKKKKAEKDKADPKPKTQANPTSTTTDDLASVEECDTQTYTVATSFEDVCVAETTTFTTTIGQSFVTSTTPGVSLRYQFSSIDEEIIEEGETILESKVVVEGTELTSEEGETTQTPSDGSTPENKDKPKSPPKHRHAGKSRDSG